MNKLSLYTQGGSSSSTYSPVQDHSLSAAIRTHDIKEIHKAAGRGALADSQSLTLACLTNNPRIVRFVLGEGAWADDKTMEVAIKTGNEEIIKLVTPLCSRIDAVARPAMATDALTNACKTGREAIVREAIEKGAKPDKNTYPIALMNKIVFAINHQSIYQSSFDVAEMLKVQWHTDMNFYTPVLIFLISQRGLVFPSIYPYRFELARALIDSPIELQRLAIRANLVTQADFDKFKETKKLKEEKDWIEENVISAKGLTLYPSLSSGIGKVYYDRAKEIKEIVDEFYSKIHADKLNKLPYP